MRRPGHNHLDRSRALAPRDYATDPARFGDDPSLRFQVARRGDEVSAQLARFQHELVVAYRQAPNAPSGSALGRRFGFSRQTFSDVLLGKRWYCQATVAAIVLALQGRIDRASTANH